MLRFLPAAVREPRRPLLAILVGWALAFFPSLALSALTQLLLPSVERPDFEITEGTILLFVLFAPFVETLIMAAFLELMLRVRIPPAVAIVLSAIGWGLAHSYMAPAWGLVIWWPFLIFSTLYVTWSKRSIAGAVLLVTAVHGLQNLLPALLLAYGSPG